MKRFSLFLLTLSVSLLTSHSLFAQWEPEARVTTLKTSPFHSLSQPPNASWEAASPAGSEGWPGLPPGRDLIPASSDWAWQNPLPTANYFNAVDFVDANTGWAVGPQGGIYRTTDGGVTWSKQKSGIDSYHSKAVSFVNANTGWAAAGRAGAGAILHTTDGGATWITQRTGSEEWQGVSFADANTGTVVGWPRVILHTTDGGQTWNNQNSGTSDYLMAVCFVNANTGWVLGSGPSVLRTTNGGANWTPQNSGMTGVPRAVCFVDANTGWVVGDRGAVLRTTDAGANWTSQTSGTTDLLESVSFFNANTGMAAGYLAGSLQGSVIGTTDGGATWALLYRDPDPYSGSQLFGVSLASANTAIAVGGVSGTNGRAQILRTTNSGANWTSQIKDMTLEHNNPYRHPFLRDVFFSDARNGWVVGFGSSIFHTTNGGATWVYHDCGGISTAFFYGASFADANTGTVVGTGSQIFRTTNGGATWTSQTATSNDFYGLCFLNASTGWVVGAGGTGGVILRTTNGGANWVAQLSGLPYYLSGVDFINAATGWAVGGAGDSAAILRTTNGGANWTSQAPGVTQALITVDFTDANTGFAGGNSGTLLRTTNGGTTWTPVTSHGMAAYVAGLSFPAANLVAIVGPSSGGLANNICLSTDLGSTWINPHVTMNFLNGVHFPKADTGWVVGDGGVVLRYTASGPVSVEEEAAEAREPGLRLKAIPNPFVSFATIPGHERESFALYDVSGRRIGIYKGDRIGEGLSPGVYFLKPEGRAAKPLRIVKVR